MEGGKMCNPEDSDEIYSYTSRDSDMDLSLNVFMFYYFFITLQLINKTIKEWVYKGTRPAMPPIQIHNPSTCPSDGSHRQHVS